MWLACWGHGEAMGREAIKAGTGQLAKSFMSLAKGSGLTLAMVAILVRIFGKE